LQWVKGAQDSKVLRPVAAAEPARLRWGAQRPQTGTPRLSSYTSTAEWRHGLDLR